MCVCVCMCVCMCMCMFAYVYSYILPASMSVSHKIRTIPSCYSYLNFVPSRICRFFVLF